MRAAQLTALVALLLVPSPVVGKVGPNIQLALDGSHRGLLGALMGEQTPLEEVIDEHAQINGIKTPDDLKALPTDVSFFRPDQPASSALTPDAMKAILFPNANNTAVDSTDDSSGEAEDVATDPTGDSSGEAEDTAVDSTGDTSGEAEDVEDASDAASPAASSTASDAATPSRIQRHKRSEITRAPEGDGAGLPPLAQTPPAPLSDAACARRCSRSLGREARRLRSRASRCPCGATQRVPELSLAPCGDAARIESVRAASRSRSFLAHAASATPPPSSSSFWSSSSSRGGREQRLPLAVQRTREAAARLAEEKAKEREKYPTVDEIVAGVVGKYPSVDEIAEAVELCDCSALEKIVENIPYISGINAGCDATSNGTVPQLLNPSFEHAYGLEHWLATPLSDGAIAVVTDPAYPDNYAQGGIPHSLQLTPLEAPGFAPNANGTTNAAVSQRLRVCPGKKYQLAFQFRWSAAGAAAAGGGAAAAAVDAGALCRLHFSFAEGERASASAWSALNPSPDSWTRVTITSTTPEDARWVYLTLGVTCPAVGAPVGSAIIDSLDLTLAA